MTGAVVTSVGSASGSAVASILVMDEKWPSLMSGRVPYPLVESLGPLTGVGNYVAGGLWTIAAGVATSVTSVGPLAYPLTRTTQIGQPLTLTVDVGLNPLASPLTIKLGTQTLYSATPAPGAHIVVSTLTTAATASFTAQFDTGVGGTLTTLSLLL